VDLLRNIRSDRVRHRKKQPYGSGVFRTVSAIVKEYGLDESFLKLLDYPEAFLARQGMEPREFKTKRGGDFPPFVLISKAEYQLAMTIAEKLDNAYLQFARSPEEMILSATLYAANPSLRPRDLLRHDFETLLLCERAREELSGLERRLRSLDGTVGRDREEEECRGEGSQSNALRERINQLQTFVAKVENTEFRTQ
jgi:hypothetical protein